MPLNMIWLKSCNIHMHIKFVASQHACVRVHVCTYVRPCFSCFRMFLFMRTYVRMYGTFHKNWMTNGGRSTDVRRSDNRPILITSLIAH